MPPQKPVVHLVGSIPLDNTEKVFRNVCKVLGDNLCRLPDGETGKRLGWIKFLQDYLNNPIYSKKFQNMTVIFKPSLNIKPIYQKFLINLSIL